MNTNFTIASAIGLSLLSTTFSSCAGPLGRGGYESAPYKTVKSDGAFEIRDYPELVVATATTPKNDLDRNSAFMTLFRTGGKLDRAKYGRDSIDPIPPSSPA